MLINCSPAIIKLASVNSRTQDSFESHNLHVKYYSSNVCVMFIFNCFKCYQIVSIVLYKLRYQA